MPDCVGTSHRSPSWRGRRSEGFVWEDTRPYSNSPWSLGFVIPEPPEDGRWVAEATFDEPGTYVLRGLVDDGGLAVYHDVTVVVSPLTL